MCFQSFFVSQYDTLLEMKTISGETSPWKIINSRIISDSQTGETGTKEHKQKFMLSYKDWH